MAPGADERGERLGEARNLTKADVFVVKDGGRTVVVKTLESRPGISRHLLGGFLLRREGRLLAKLRGTAGVPALLEAGRDRLVVEWMPGRNLFELRKVGIDAPTAERLEALVRSLHERGFAHGDIGRRDVLVDDDGSVRLVDFATAVGPGAPPLLWRVLLPIWRRRDRVRVAKLVARYRRRWERNARIAAERRAARA